MQQRWRHLHNSTLGPWNDLSHDMTRIESMYPNLLPDLRSESLILVYSDYSGSVKGADFQTLSYLILGNSNVNSWDVERCAVRKEYLTGRGEMSFKELHDIARRNALMPFLNAADKINGLLITIGIDGRIVHLFTDSNATNANGTMSRDWTNKPKVLESALRIVLFGGFFTAGLIRHGQIVRWITDEDDIIANPQRRGDVRDLWLGWMKMLLNTPPPGVTIASTRNDDGSYLAKDTAAIPDLVAGALAKALREIRDKTDILKKGQSNVMSWSKLAKNGNLSDKSRKILDWLSDETKSLKRLALVVVKDEGDTRMRRIWMRFGEIHK